MGLWGPRKVVPWGYPILSLVFLQVSKRCIVGDGEGVELRRACGAGGGLDRLHERAAG